MTDTNAKTKVTIGVLTYNHERYIEECLASVVSQTGDFDLKIVIVNDRSKDSTDKMIQRFIKAHEGLDIEYVVNENNLGTQKSIYKTLGLIKATKSEYWSYIEGDDKYLDADRTQKHLNLLKSDKTAIMSYNKLLLIDQNSKTITEHEPDRLDKVLTTEQLAAQNHIGSFCATFFTARCFDRFDPAEFEGFTVYDWFFDIWMSQFGSIRLLPEYLAGYRQHSASVWSSMSQMKQYWELIWSIDAYNKKLEFGYDGAFQSYKRNLINQLSAIGTPMAVDIAVLSEGFLSPEDTFTSGETTYLLQNNTSITAVATAKRSKNLTAAAKKYKQDNADFASKVIGYDGDYDVTTKCIYATSIDDAYYKALPITNYHDTLLVFEICKADEANVEAADAIKKLKAICKSANFVEVVVHSEKVKLSLIRNKLCDESRIALIPSSVSEKIYGKNELYNPEQAKSYCFQINNLLRRCISGELRPAPPSTLRKLKRRYRALRLAGVRRLKAIVRRNAVLLFIARGVVKLKSLLYQPKE